MNRALGTIMPYTTQAKLTVIAEFPEHYFLENLAVRSDGSILVTAMTKKELWCLPAPGETLPVKPMLVHTFDFMTMFVVETDPDVFVIASADVYGSREARLYRLDLNGWKPGGSIKPQLIVEFPEPKVGLNGGCMIGPRVLLAAGAANLIWRVDLPNDASSASARIWLQHDNMKNRPGEKKPEQPGVNGIRYAAKTNHLYYTSTSQQLMLRVKVDPKTLEPADLPEFIAGGREWDDFILDEEAGVAYVTTHRENTIDRVKMQPDGNRDGRTAIAGDPFTGILVGPSSGAWGHREGDYGRTAYFTTDGGTASSPDGKVRTAKVLRVDFPPA
jgi:hypothetical protein